MESAAYFPYQSPFLSFSLGPYLCRCPSSCSFTTGIWWHAVLEVTRSKLLKLNTVYINRKILHGPLEVLIEQNSFYKQNVLLSLNMQVDRFLTLCPLVLLFVITATMFILSECYDAAAWERIMV